MPQFIFKIKLLYYVKTILPLAWRQKILPNWRAQIWRFCRRVLRLGAVAAFDVAHEWRLLLRLQERGVLAPEPVAFGALGDDYSVPNAVALFNCHAL